MGGSLVDEFGIAHLDAALELPVADVEQFDGFYHDVGQVTVEAPGYPSALAVGKMGQRAAQVVVDGVTAVADHMIEQAGHGIAEHVEHAKRQQRQQAQGGEDERLFHAADLLADELHDVLGRSLVLPRVAHGFFADVGQLVVGVLKRSEPLVDVVGRLHNGAHADGGHLARRDMLLNSRAEGYGQSVGYGLDDAVDERRESASHVGPRAVAIEARKGSYEIDNENLGGGKVFLVGAKRIALRTSLRVALNRPQSARTDFVGDEKELRVGMFLCQMADEFEVVGVVDTSADEQASACALEEAFDDGVAIVALSHGSHIVEERVARKFGVFYAGFLHVAQRNLAQRGCMGKGLDGFAKQQVSVPTQ